MLSATAEPHWKAAKLTRPKFDRTYIRAKDDKLGLRTIRSITDMAEQWGFVEESRNELPKGNSFVVWRVRQTA